VNHLPPSPAAGPGPGTGPGPGAAAGVPAGGLLLFLAGARRPRRPPPVDGRIPKHLKVNHSEFENSAA